MHLDRTTRRILGSLIEKRLSTPEQYPLTMNALVLACNQRSNRDPFLDLQEFEIQGCVLGLRQKELLTIVERDFGRTARYRERLSEALALGDEESSVLAELLLRGPQTEQELSRRCPRMVPTVASPEAALALLEKLAAAGIAERLPRETGQRHARWRHRMTPPEEGHEPGSATEAPTAQVVLTAPEAHGNAPPPPAAERPPNLADRVAQLERELTLLRESVASLRGEIARLSAGNRAGS